VPTLEGSSLDARAVDRTQNPSNSPTALGHARRIWIDLDNTPHVPFFLPIIRALENDGHSVLVTARDAFQVRALAEYHGLACRTIGRHYGANKAFKIAGTLWRALQLLSVVLRERPDVSMSHGSRPLELVSFFLGIPSMLIFDYEHARRLPFVRATIGVAPSSLSDPRLTKAFRLGLRTYDGLKEDVYAATFRPDETILSELGVRSGAILVTIRPPATEAHYHNPEADRLFTEVVNLLGAFPSVQMVILPRTAGSQRESIRRAWPEWCDEGKIILPKQALDGLNLVWFSDLVVSGGGTMNREAAALGVPVYSIFRGKLGNVDRYLAQEGRLTLLKTSDDVRSRLKPEKRERGTGPSAAQRPALRQILEVAAELMRLPNGPS
jgi:uncharacterized protein